MIYTTVESLSKTLHANGIHDINDHDMSVQGIKDSGDRREFESGAVRDMLSGKGRCDLMPLAEIADIVEDRDVNMAAFLRCIDKFIYTGDIQNLIIALRIFIQPTWKYADYFLLLSQHYENGSKKYGERNWEKGIPLHSYIDSAIRHYLKYKASWSDEPHHLAVGWNILGAIWTVRHKPEMIDLPYKDKLSYDNKQ